jgi:hypothetical protein
MLMTFLGAKVSAIWAARPAAAALETVPPRMTESLEMLTPMA